MTGGLTPNQLASYLTGPGVTISNVTMTCPGGASGTFNGTASNVGIGSGVLLTSGAINNAPGPNNTNSSTTSNNANGDPLLNSLAQATTHDACALEFDLVASCDTIQIAYVFGSEEYPEFVNGGFNDAFGFFVTGPNPGGGNYTNFNIARIPGTTTPVTIDNVNRGNYQCPGPPSGCVNCTYYVDNCGGATVQYDGFTTPLLAIAPVVPCSTYHIKLVVADAGDWSYDSGVFLEQGGIRCFSGQISINTFSSNGSNYLVEGCTNGAFTIVRSGDLSFPLTLHYSVGGTATQGTDYAGIGTSITFGIGVDSVAIPINPTQDALNEGIESIYIIINDTVCSYIFSDTAVILISDMPNAQFIQTTVCQGSPTTFTDQSTFPPGPITAWTWDFGDGGTASTANPQHTYTSAGTYTATLTVNTIDGCTDSYSNTVTVNPLPTSSFTYSGVCFGHPTLFTDNSSISSGTITAWDWDFGDANTSTQQNPSYIYSAPGTYSVTLTTTSGNGCNNSFTQSITINPSPQPDYDALPVCLNEVTNFINTTTVPGGFVAGSFWNFDDGSTSVIESPTHTYAAPGTYNVTLVVTTGDGCIDSTTKAVVVHPLPVVNFTSTVTCFFDTTQFTDLTTILTGNISSYSWDFGDGSTSTQHNPSHVYLEPGFFNVTLIATSDKGCVSELTKPAEVTPPPYTPIVENDTVCNGYAPTLSVDAPNSVTIFWYYTPDGGSPFHVGKDLHMQPIDRDFTYWVEAIDANGCRSPLIPIHAEANGPPSGGMMASAYQTEIPNAIVEFWLNDPIRPIEFYNWDFGDGTTSQSPTPVHQYSAPGTYEVVLHMIDFRGCESTMYLTVEVDERIRLYVPTGFTPNNDNDNDYFSIQHRLLTSIQLSVFDRWGKLVYQTYDLNFKWDGKDSKNQDLPEGVYMYVIEANAYNGAPITKSGSVTIIR
ncbi:MAG: choice-of-anchor L domain-containing protein [Bacteroidia bacterium]|nr:choice-of-anchor L domain-containing protein [Bacteroidia bacterium]